ncbi:MAG: HD domain-containing protein [Alphaproteobacteria bacterium]|nr:HD domain-containing protein [Alphaproteobacteria bacterium]
MKIRDPIHKGITLDASEVEVVRSPWVQRLRNIGQTGFASLPFPGATHSRFSHSLGVMHLAGRAFDQAYRDWTFSDPGARERFRSVVRIAALAHDLGHAPFSHCTEFAMPALADLGSTWLRPEPRRATHEDYTLAILEHTALGPTIAGAFPFTARHVAALISGDVRVGDDFFRDGGFDHRRLLSQIVSSELDVDRLDYLVRDAIYTGATYGQVDVDWLITNLTCWPADGAVGLGLDARAIYAFDDFLISRHHMFLMVYFHHESVVYEEMLKRHVQSEACTWSLPSDLDAYLQVDDIHLLMHLRASAEPWARRVIDHQPWIRILERHGSPSQADVGQEADRLRDAGLDPIVATSTGRLSRYADVGRKRRRAPSIYVVHGDRRATPSRTPPRSSSGTRTTGASAASTWPRRPRPGAQDRPAGVTRAARWGRPAR